MNIEATIYMTLRESKSFRQHGLPIPLIMEQLLHRERYVLDFAKCLQDALDEFRFVRGRFTPLFKDMLRVNIDEMDATIAPGNLY